MSDKYLIHYGVLGMKWGVRKEYEPKRRKKARQPVKSKERKGLSEAQKKAIRTGVIAVGGVLAVYGAYKIGVFKNTKIVTNGLGIYEEFKDLPVSMFEGDIKSLSDLPKIEGEHSIEQDLKTVNPNFNEKGQTGKANQINCSNCVNAYELRRRGYDVEALPRFDGRSTEEIASLYKNAKVEELDYTFWRRNKVPTKETIINIEEYMLNCGEGARGIITGGWKFFGGAHTFNVEVKNGAVNFLDAQNNMRDVKTYFYFMKGLSLFRTDNLDLNEDILDTVKKRVGG